MAARWLLNQLTTPSSKRPGITNTIPDRPRRNQFPNNYLRGLESGNNTDVPQYIHMLRASTGGISSRPRSTSASSYVVQQRRRYNDGESPTRHRSHSNNSVSSEVPVHLRTDPHVKNEVPAHLRTDNYDVARNTKSKKGSQTLDDIHSSFTLSYLSQAENEQQARRERHRSKKEAVKQAKKRDEDRAKIAYEKKLRSKREIAGKKRNSSSSSSGGGSSSGSRSGTRTMNSIRYQNLPRVNARWVNNERNSNSHLSSAHNNEYATTTTTNNNNNSNFSNVKETPFSAVVIDTFAASSDKELSVEAGMEVVVIDNRQSQTMWLITIQNKHRETGWIPSSILLFDGMSTPREQVREQPQRMPFTSNNDYRNGNNNSAIIRRSRNTSASGNSAVPTFRPALGDNPIFYVKAMKTREAQTVRELDITKNEIMMVTDCQQSTYWWYGHREFNPEEAGWFPIDCVKKVSDEERLKLSGISNNNSNFNNAPMSSPSKTRERKVGSKYAIKSIVTPSNRNMSTKSFSFNTDENKKKAANDGRQLMNSGMVVEPNRVLRRFVSKGGTEWTELKKLDDDGVVYVNESTNRWQNDRPLSAQPLRRFSSSGGTHWAELVDDQGRHYYHNTEHGGRTIKPPKDIKNNLRRISSVKGSTWEEMIDKETGQKYWYNLDTQVSTWEDPTESGGVVESKGRDDDEVTTPMRRKVPDCIICMDSPACVALMPCWHATYCAGCADKLEKCPQCKTPVEGRQKFYL